jgi:hypothetical protein
VADAYGWPTTLTGPEIVTRIVALNAERRAEEATGKIRWLRPEFQAPAETAQLKTQTAMDIGEAIAPAAITPWPKGEAAQYIALRTALATTPATPTDLARLFKGTTSQKIATMAKTLVALGQARTPTPGRYAT